MSSINNPDNPEFNRGVEVILRGKKTKKKTFSVCFEKIISFFKKEIIICFNFSFDIKN
jgi:hypothetical protein